MLDRRADFRFRIVGPPHRFGHNAAFRLLAMDVSCGRPEHDPPTLAPGTA